MHLGKKKNKKSEKSKHQKLYYVDERNVRISEKILYSWVGRTDFFKIFTLLQSVYRFNRIPKISMTLLTNM